MLGAAPVHCSVWHQPCLSGTGDSLSRHSPRFSTSAATGAPVDSELTVEQMAVRKHIIEMHVLRFAAFDGQDLDGAMKDFMPEGAKFVVKAPGADDLVMEGFDAIKGLETTFMNLIKDNFGECYHELVQWKWASITDEVAECSVYMKLWLTDKTTGTWKQQDLSGKSGRFWAELKHRKVGQKWMLESQVALSED